MVSENSTNPKGL